LSLKAIIKGKTKTWISKLVCDAFIRYAQSQNYWKPNN